MELLLLMLRDRCVPLLDLRLLWGMEVLLMELLLLMLWDWCVPLLDLRLLWGMDVLGRSGWQVGGGRERRRGGGVRGRCVLGRSGWQIGRGSKRWRGRWGGCVLGRRGRHRGGGHDRRRKRRRGGRAGRGTEKRGCKGGGRGSDGGRGGRICVGSSCRRRKRCPSLRAAAVRMHKSQSLSCGKLAWPGHVCSCWCWCLTKAGGRLPHLKAVAPSDGCCPI